MPDGAILPADAYGQMYVATRKVWKRKPDEHKLLDNTNKYKDITENSIALKVIQKMESMM